MLGTVARKALGMLKNSSKSPTYPKVTADEMELMNYKRREYLDGVKKELSHYRKKNELMNQGMTIHKEDKTHNIMRAKNTLIGKERGMLNGRGVLFR